MTVAEGETRPPTVSIVVPVFNDRAHLEGLLRFLLKQDFPSFVVAFVDDHPTDGSFEFLQERTSDRVLLVRTEKNSGIGHARNVGVKASDSELIAFIDSDCPAEPNWLFRLVMPLLEKRADATIGPKYIPLRSSRGAKLESTRVKQYGGIDTKNFAITRTALDPLVGFDETLRTNADYELHTRLKREGFRPEHTGAIVRHDFPDDPIRLIVRVTRRAKDEAKLYRDRRSLRSLTNLLGNRVIEKCRRTPRIFRERDSLVEGLALAAYYLFFHLAWNLSLAVAMFRSRLAKSPDSC